MSTTCNLNQQRPVMYNWLFALLAAVLFAVTAMMPAPVKAAPLAGSSIGNQAAATYTDASAVSRTVTSNTVNTIVQQVASFTLTAAQTKTVSPGGTVYYPHTLTNTGNGTDTFNLSAANLATNGVTPSTFDFSTIQIFADNGSGLPTGPAITSTTALAAGGVFKFVIAAAAPASATNGQVDYLNATASGTATATPAPAQTNLDTATVSGNAVINVTKSISASSGAAPSGPYTYTLTYTNTGNATATALTLTDLIPAGMTYVPASARWSVTGVGVTLTDLDTVAQGTAPATIVYDFGVTVPGRATAVINQVPPGNTGTLTFTVNVNAGVAPSTISNTAAYTYNDGAALVPSQNTNTPTFTVNQTASETLTGATVASAPQGSTVPFTNIVTNTGNGIDSFDITINAATASAFPAGTTFQLFKSDGVTPLVDTNGNSVPDTGPLAAGATYNVILKATLPPSATGGPYTVQKTAISKFNPAVTATATDTLTVIAASTLDLTNNSARTDSTPAGTAAPGTLGFGTTGTTTIITNTTNPGTTTRFTLFVNNTSGPADSYNLAALGLPAGATVVFRDTTSTGIGTGAIITNTGVINAGANVRVFADVTVPSNAAPGTSPIDFTATSPTTGASDVIRDAVTVNAVNSVTLTPNNSGQVFPGGSVVYTHTLTNNGNAPQTITFPTALTDSQVAAGWTSVAYLDNGSTPGVLDATDTPISPTTTFVLAAGASQPLLVKVTAPLGAAISALDTTTFTATYPTGTAVATDSSTVIGGQVTLTKLQAIDVACDGTADTAFANTNITTGAIPGACVRYQITATNVGTSAVTNLVVSDGTPGNTTYNVGSTPNPAAVTGAGNTITAPAAGSAGTIQATIPTLATGASVVVTFGVRINP